MQYSHIYIYFCTHIYVCKGQHYAPRKGKAAEKSAEHYRSQLFKGDMKGLEMSIVLIIARPSSDNSVKWWNDVQPHFNFSNASTLNFPTFTHFAYFLISAEYFLICYKDLGLHAYLPTCIHICKHLGLLLAQTHIQMVSIRGNVLTNRKEMLTLALGLF